MTKVVIESPLAADTEEGREANRQYALRCCRDAVLSREAPYASHLFFDRPGLLDATRPAEREAGMLAGFAWGAAADLVAVYIDRGISEGMRRGIDRAKAAGQRVVYRSIGGGWRFEWLFEPSPAVIAAWRDGVHP